MDGYDVLGLLVVGGTLGFALWLLDAMYDDSRKDGER